MDLLEAHQPHRRTTVLVATHDREMVDNMRRRVIALDRGHPPRDQDQGCTVSMSSFFYFIKESLKGLLRATCRRRWDPS